jgi:hypothetical protein
LKNDKLQNLLSSAVNFNGKMAVGRVDNRHKLTKFDHPRVARELRAQAIAAKDYAQVHWNAKSVLGANFFGSTNT